MISGTEYNKSDKALNAKNILSMISEYDIYRYYLGYDFVPKRNYPSPFRSEKKGSFNIYYTFNGRLKHYDFGNEMYKGNCFEFVKQLFNCNYNEALIRINNDFNLQLGKASANSSGDRQYSVPDTKVLFRQEQLDNNSDFRVRIHVEPKPLSSEDVKYWGQYGISVEDLITEQVFSVGKLWINGKYIYNTEKTIKFAYYYEVNGEVYFKIYSPYSEDYKWISNVPVKLPINIEKLPKKSNIIIIAKSKKDKMVLQKIHSDVYEVQKEGFECISEEVDNFFNENYDAKFCFFDNDDAGKRANIALNSKGYGWINIPNEYIQENIKDPSDLVQKFGIEDGYNILDFLIKQKISGI